MPDFPTSLRSRFTSPRPLPLPRRPTRAVAATLALALTLALAGCATPMLSSGVEMPESFAAAAPADAAAEIAWWQGYGDPVLAGLIERAARENRDVRIAAERVRAARAGATISRSWLLPSLGLNAGTTQSDGDYSGGKQLAFPEVDRSHAGLDVSWEIDLSGRLRAGAAAADAQALATADQARGVRLLAITDVATSYFMLIGAERQLDTVRAISAAQDETLRQVRARQRVGLASSFDVERAQTDAERARSAITSLQTLVAVSRHRIAVLIGEQPTAAAAIEPWDGRIAVPEVVSGQPAELLERRPDLLAARAQLDAANYRRQQAAAEWFPRLFVGALFGRENVDVNGIGLGSARFGNAAGLLTMPLFDWGRTRASNEIAEAEQSAALLGYEDAIVRALEDVENALVALKGERQRAGVLAAAAASADAALGHAQSLYDRGQIDLLPLLDAQRARLAARLSANDSDTELLQGSVRLFKALGGGWQAFEADSAAAADLKQAPVSPSSASVTKDPS